MIGIELEQAIALLQKIQHKNDIIEKDLLSAMDHISAEDIYAGMNNPPFDRSPLDGYAIKAGDSKPVSGKSNPTLDVVGIVYAGDCYEGTIDHGQAVRIMTGAPMPAGSDCVIRHEDTDNGLNQVTLYEGLEAYQNYCFEGEDIKKGTCIIRKGTKISYQHIAVLASMGISKLCVIKPLTIGLMSTGDEVIDVDEQLTPGKIYNSNGYILTAKLQALGFTIQHIGDCGDDADVVANTISQAVDDVDIIITTGGVSVGDKDIMHDVIVNLGAERLFWKINIKPGTPVLAAQYRGKLMIGLSGNPFAALATFEVLVRPVLAKLACNQDIDVVRTTGILRNAFNKAGGRRRLLRAKYDNGYVEIPMDNHSSGAMYSMLECNALIDVASDTDQLKVGEQVSVVLI